MTRSTRSRRDPAGPRLWVLLAVALATVAAACDGDEGDGGDGSAATTTTTEDATAGWVTCESPESGYRVAHPPGWTTNDGDVMPPCSLFHPGPFDVPEQTEIPTDIAVAITVEPEPGGDPDAGGLGERVLSEEEATVDGRPATRTEVEATGDALYPEGQRTTRWTVVVDGGRVVARTHDRGEPAYDDKKELLDRMVASLSVIDDDEGPAPPEPNGDAADPVGEPGFDEAASGDFPAGFNGDKAFLTDVRVAARDGHDRIVFEFDADVAPSYRALFVDPPIREDPSGRTLDVAGDAFLEVGMQPASGVDLSGDEVRRVYTGEDRLVLSGGAAVTEVVKTGDWESDLTWVVGMRERTPFAVATLTDPVRLVVDVVSDRGA